MGAPCEDHQGERDNRSRYDGLHRSALALLGLVFVIGLALGVKGLGMDFKSLDHDVRTLALVGGFLQEWSFMEGSLNTAIGKALKTDNLQTVIVTKNVQFTAKIHILKTAVSLSHLLSDDRDATTKMLNIISNASPIRNMMAHDIFVPSKKTDGVEFLVIKAKGVLNFPDIDWSIEEFEKWYRQLRYWSTEITSISRRLSPSDPKSLAQALMQYAEPSEPRGLFGGLGYPNFLSSQPQVGPDLGLPEPTPEPNPQTSEGPEEE